ncbi:MAG: hypothetical protein B6D36_09725 [Planctomycetes bacterium UTPLA1]|jgi:predicted TIM-barrel enzyme|nr:MAG: hypothetical protein B6D36_09725 [Planctomycetes bacterium UTPLA1]
MRLFRWRKKLLFMVAALPLLQATGTCDPFALNSTIGTSLASAGFSVVVGSIQSVLLQNFPSADILQTLLGGNRQPFFQN